MASPNDASVESNSVQENEKISLRRSFEEVIQKLEEVFSQMPNPENHVMEKLSEELELDITQIGIWFENKRYYIQAQKEMEEDEIIRLENEKLRSENLQLCSELKKRFCATCNNPEQQRAILQDLQNENAKLGEEVTMISNIIDRFKDDPEGYLSLLQRNYRLREYKDPNGVDLELGLGCSNDPNGPDLELNLN